MIYYYLGANTVAGNTAIAGATYAHLMASEVTPIILPTNGVDAHVQDSIIGGQIDDGGLVAQVSNIEVVAETGC